MTVLNIIILIFVVFLACIASVVVGFFIAHNRDEPVKARLQQERDYFQARLVAKDMVLQFMTGAQQEIKNRVSVASHRIEGASDYLNKAEGELEELKRKLDGVQTLLIEKERELAELQDSLPLVPGQEPGEDADRNE